MLALLRAIDRLLNGPAPAFSASLRERIGYGLAKGLVLATVLTVVLGVGLLAGAGAGIEELGGARAFVQLYLGSCVGGAVLFYGLRPLYMWTGGLVASGVVTLACVVWLLMLLVGREAGGTLPVLKGSAIALVVGFLPGVGLAFLQRRSDIRHGLIRVSNRDDR
jgi:hypothetical protein